MAEDQAQKDLKRSKYEIMVYAYWETIHAKYHEEGHICPDDIKAVMELQHKMAMESETMDSILPAEGSEILAKFFSGTIKKKSGRPKRSLHDEMNVQNAKFLFEREVDSGKTAKEAIEIISDRLNISEATAYNWVYKVCASENTPLHNVAEKLARLHEEKEANGG
jgi:hypothetical protein